MESGQCPWCHQMGVCAQSGDPASRLCPCPHAVLNLLLPLGLPQHLPSTLTGSPSNRHLHPAGLVPSCCARQRRAQPIPKQGGSGRVGDVWDSLREPNWTEPETSWRGLVDITARNLCWDKGVAMFALVKVISGFVGQEAKIFGAGGLLVTCNHTWDLPLQTHPHADYIRSTLKPGTLPSIQQILCPRCLRGKWSQSEDALPKSRSSGWGTKPNCSQLQTPGLLGACGCAVGSFRWGCPRCLARRAGGGPAEEAARRLGGCTWPAQGGPRAPYFIFTLRCSGVPGARSDALDIAPADHREWVGQRANGDWERTVWEAVQWFQRWVGGCSRDKRHVHGARGNMIRPASTCRAPPPWVSCMGMEKVWGYRSLETGDALRAKKRRAREKKSLRWGFSLSPPPPSSQQTYMELFPPSIQPGLCLCRCRPQSGDHVDWPRTLSTQSGLN